MSLSQGKWVGLAVVALALCGVLRAGEGDAPAGGQGGNRQRGNFDPEQMRQRIMERLKETLAPSDDEWKVLQPKIEAVQKAQAEARTMGFGGMRGRGRGQGPQTGIPAGGAEAPAQREPRNDLERKSQELSALLEKKDSDPKTITDKLQELRDTREKARAALKKAQDELKELLTPQQEARLVMMGMLD